MITLLVTMSAPAAAQERPRPLATQLGEIVAQAEFDTLSEAVRQRLRLTIIDNLASLAAATPHHCDDPFIARLRSRGGAPEAWVPGCGFRLPSEDAAAAIAYLIHANETDDSDFRAELRASPPIFGAALAASQANRTDGHTFAAALATGYSVQGALAAAYGPLQPRFMTSGIWGAPGAASASATAFGLNAEETAAAITLSASAAAGPFQYFYDQSEDKRIIIARAARSGVEAAWLARAGERGAASMLEGRAGLYAALDPERALALDTQNIIDTAARLDGPLYIYPKFFSASSSIIPFLEAIAPMWAERGLGADDVAQFTLSAEPAWARVLADKIINFEPPTSAIGAQINFSFVVALYMTRGSARPQDYADATLADPAILDLARRAQFEELPVGGGTRLDITLHSGEVIRIEPNRIDPRAPAPEAIFLRERKFEQLTERLSTRDRAALRRLGEQALETRSMLDWSRQVDRILR
ncbi:MAG: hypothetical protein DCF16_05180 [Alphaproteobacteria bacterium]|nr:MAG: hypothetical protein DCF16_05180 [Alphaproteobacteria bacterium]